MIILKSVLENYIVNNHICGEKERILKFWSEDLGYITSKSLLEQIFIYDLIINIPKLSFSYPDKIYECHGNGYLRPEIPVGAETWLTYFKLTKICLYESYLYKKGNINVAMMHLGIDTDRFTSHKFSDGAVVFYNNIFYGRDDFALDKILDDFSPNKENFDLIKFACHMFDNWSSFKDCIFVNSWSEFPTDWDNYPKNKIILMLNNMLKNE